MTLSAVWAATALEPVDDAQASRAMIRESLTAVREHLGMEVAFVGRFSRGRRHVAFVDYAGDFRPLEVGDHAALADTWCGRVAEGRVPGLVQDARRLPAVRDLLALGEHRIGAHLAVPLHDDDGMTLGTLCCFSRCPDDGLGERDLNVLRMVGDVITPHLRSVIRHEQRVDHTDEWVSRVVAACGPQVALQPIVELRTNRVAAYEALSRFPADVDWTPDRWFSEAHAIGRGVELEAVALAAALGKLDLLPDDVGLSVNVSAGALLAGPDIPDLLAAAPRGRLTVELTEHQRVVTSDALSERLAALRSQGVLIAVDDAGSGYAGLEHILHLRPDVLKLDRALVQGVAHHPGRRAMCEAMVQFTRHTDALLVAEGVETEVDLDALRAIGVDRAQGFLLGRPRVV